MALLKSKVPNLFYETNTLMNIYWLARKTIDNLSTPSNAN